MFKHQAVRTKRVPAPYNYETPRCRIWFKEMVTLSGPRLNPQLT